MSDAMSPKNHVLDFDGKETNWDRDARAVLVALIRQTPIAQVVNVMPTIIFNAAEVADALAAERQKRKGAL